MPRIVPLLRSNTRDSRRRTRVYWATVDNVVGGTKTIKYRYSKDQVGGDDVDLTVRLVQGTTVLQSWTHTQISEVPTTATQTYTGPTITDGTDLRFRFEGVATSSNVPISASDANGASSEIITLFAALSASDVNGSLTQTEILTAAYAVADSSGTVTESASVVVHTTVIDTSTAVVESASEIAALSVSDTNGFSEASSLVAALSATDANGTTSEVSAVTVPISASDSNGAVTEIATQIAAYTNTDATPAVTENSSLVARPTVTDSSGVAGEATKISLAGSDVNGPVTETAAPALTITSSDTNAAIVESTALRLAGVDANQATTESGVPAVQMTSSDQNGSVTEISNALIPVSASDVNGSIIEIAAPTLAIQSTDTDSIITEVASPTAIVAASDSGTEAEAQSLVARIDAGEYSQLLGRTEDFSHADWSAYFVKPTVTSGQTDPDGGLTAWKFTPSVGGGPGGTAGITQAVGGRLTTGVYTLQVWMRADAPRSISWGLKDSYASVISIDTVWRKYTFTVNYDGVVPSNPRFFELFVLDAGAGSTPFYLWHPMTERGATVHPYLANPNAGTQFGSGATTSLPESGGISENTALRVSNVPDTNGTTVETATAVFAQSSQDAGSASGQSASLQANVTAQDGSQSVTEAAIPAVKVAGSDSNGPTVEFGTYRYIISIQADTGHGTDSQAAAIRITTVDAGTAVEGLPAITISFVVTETITAVETAVVDTHVVPGHMPGILLASMTLPELVRAEIAQPVITSAGQEEAVTLLDATESEPELVNTIISQPIITKAR